MEMPSVVNKVIAALPLLRRGRLLRRGAGDVLVLADRLVLRVVSVPAGGALEVVMLPEGWLMSARFLFCDGVLRDLAVVRSTLGVSWFGPCGEGGGRIVEFCPLHPSSSWQVFF